MNGILHWGVPLAFLMHGLGMIGGIYFVFTGQGWLAKSLGGGARTAAWLATPPRSWASVSQQAQCRPAPTRVPRWR
jgi:fructose-1,6-bisphosphatase/inositol monophosphatase family enzyme